MKQFRYKEWLFVEVPEGSKFHSVKKPQNKCNETLFWWNVAKDEQLTFDKMDFKILPQGQYSIIGKADELTEEQWHHIANKQKGSYGKFTDYGITGSLAKYGTYVLYSAKESGYSLLKSNSMQVLKLSMIGKQ